MHFFVTIINEAIDLTSFKGYGPVHLNIPFAEPIYNQEEDLPHEPAITHPEPTATAVGQQELRRLSDTWNGASRKLVIAGMMDPNPELSEVLKKLADDPSVVLLTETTTNLSGSCTCPCIDRVVHTIGDEEAGAFRPELLVTLGGNVVSKMVKSFLRKHPPASHWNIDPVTPGMNTYQCLTDGIEMEPLTLLKQLVAEVKPVQSDYRERWEERDERSEARHRTYLESCDYSDLKVFETLLERIPADSCLHLGNSTPVRYAQLFRQKRPFTYFANRGTSGIDGAVSTAAGAAHVTGKPTTLITGDLGFFYDSNALMNHHLHANLRIIIMNNRGGSIFRFIPGPGDTDQLEEFFEAHHGWTAEFIARNFNVPYYTACNLAELEELLPSFYGPQQDHCPAILEVHTPNKKNARLLKAYFNYLKE